MSKNVKQLTPKEYQQRIDAMKLHEFDKTEEFKQESKQIERECSEKLKEILSKHLFIVTDEMSKEIIECRFKYPNYNGPELKELLFRMAITKNAEFGEVGVVEGEYEMKFSLWFFTSPKQFKLIFQDRFSDYPFLLLWSKIGKKGSKATHYIITQQPISLGQAVSLLKQFKFQWL